MDRLSPSWLQTVALFGGIPEPCLEVFTASAERVVVAEGDVVYREGEQAEHLYLVEAGELRVEKGAACRCLTSLKGGDFFGEMSFVDMQCRSATVRAAAQSVLWRWPFANLHAMYREYPKAYTLFVMNIAREMSRRLRRADEVICQRP
jgi:CRP/FNR family transcriptional regulator, cyclic AMP receptor protein